jgi:hypothetical protein
MTPERDLLDILRDKAEVTGRMYRRAASEPQGVESQDTIDKLRLSWLECEEAVAREILRKSPSPGGAS